MEAIGRIKRGLAKQSEEAWQNPGVKKDLDQKQVTREVFNQGRQILAQSGARQLCDAIVDDPEIPFSQTIERALVVINDEGEFQPVGVSLNVRSRASGGADIYYGHCFFVNGDTRDQSLGVFSQAPAQKVIPPDNGWDQEHRERVEEAIVEAALTPGRYQWIEGQWGENQHVRVWPRDLILGGRLEAE